VIHPIRGLNGNAPMRLWANLFEIANLGDLAVEYRWVDVRNLPPGESVEKHTNQLLKAVAYDLRQPVALVRDDAHHRLAIPASIDGIPDEVTLAPHTVTLVPQAETNSLNLCDLDGTTTPIAMQFLEFALRTPLRVPIKTGHGRSCQQMRAQPRSRKA
jgi:hypothetical protein